MIAASWRRGLLWGNAVVKVLDEHERTMAFAEVALGQIRSLRQTAVPRNYEIWYVYATGYNPPLNKIINETLARNGKLTEADLEQIYETYLSHIKTTDRIDKVGARVISEIDEVMTPLTDALGMSASYDASLDDASQKLGAAKSREQVKAIVEVLVKSTHEMRETNKALEDRLTLYKNEISNLQQSLEAIRAGAAAGRHVVEADHQGPGHHRPLWRRGVRGRAAQHRAAPGADGGRSHPPRRDGQGIEEEINRRDSRPGHHLGRGVDAEAG